ncbi:hypothetical protein AVEN_108844-1 [Araneus ventricosus]|uniref:Uncharacterized protein n=1 Tax=Araneus ventricosus TaxID=182803 RepID=A0A4Y2PC56_ARAVE|nr:hypothetical protein AVEN_72788-1 [Araneus ventricosus]GBN49568.1 hypothetical protein AVEN_108844-1 [Araneus ventricosus]
MNGLSSSAEEDTDKFEMGTYSEAPLKQGVLGRERQELDSPTLGGHLHHHYILCYNLPEKRMEMGCVWQG